MHNDRARDECQTTYAFAFAFAWRMLVVGHNVIARCLKVKVDVDPRRRRLW